MRNEHAMMIKLQRDLMRKKHIFLTLQLARHIQGKKRGHNEMARISPNVLNDGDLQER